MSRRKVIFLLVLFFPVLIVAGRVAWLIGPGRFSYRNFERIEKGMELEQVETLLGSPGEEISFSEIPGVPSYAKFPDAPDGWLGMVWGERCFIWWDGDQRGYCTRKIYIGVSGDRVVSKYFDELSL